jgi:hypothetical protein
MRLKRITHEIYENKALMKKVQNVIENARDSMIFDPRNCENRPQSPPSQYLIDKKQLICVGRTRGQYVVENKRLNEGVRCWVGGSRSGRDSGLGVRDSGAGWLRRTFCILPTADCLLLSAPSRDQPAVIFSLAVHFCPRRSWREDTRFPHVVRTDGNGFEPARLRPSPLEEEPEPP